ncbi:ATP-grasp domain-containing protein [Anaerosacchariphilus polymeriproducens]|uniref:ATP-grasp domain-containing protein n=1 Tax=Anaerosacchariphilus polymeriproducens TaxID=1812858 RepID=A0A371AY74_9FIRM|nr:ATP-grasp domain-containing protein [Anaerosacchariphilus polymeriproducens]RDU24440.1 ATP-grasp domain-containing protein [Anaerosacchariphilus polymeriproducens]
MERILVTAIGSLSADITIKTLKQMGFFVVGCDIYPQPWVVDAYEVDVFVQTPGVKEESYLSFFEELCSQQQISYIIPLIDLEVDVLSVHKERFQSKGITICTLSEICAKQCRDKYQLPRQLSSLGEKYGIRMLMGNLLKDINVDELTFPVIVKPRNGRSSQGCQLIYNEKGIEYLSTIDTEQNLLVQNYVKGQVITVDVVCDSQRKDAVAVARKELLRTANGAGTTVSIIREPIVEEFCRQAAIHLQIQGAVNFEFLVDEEKNYYFLEINPRFSGGVEFTHLAGYNVIKNHMNCFRNVTINTCEEIKEMTVARKYEEYITEGSDKV